MNNPFTPIAVRGDGKITKVVGQAAGHADAHRADLKEAMPFAPLREGNKVECFPTGKAYFAALAKAMKGAKRHIFIAGWQVNWDVELEDGERLIDILHDRVQSSESFRVYVMPWMSPKVGVNTGDLGTMLAVFQLNAGRKNLQAFCCPAGAQSDFVGSEGAAFSHHQKMIVIDNKIGFIGGMDLAYGRRDDEHFSLDPGDRRFNERYNPGIPSMQKITPKDGRSLSDIDLLASTLTCQLWNKGGNTDPTALGEALHYAMEHATKAAVEAVELVNETIKFEYEFGKGALSTSVEGARILKDATVHTINEAGAVLAATADNIAVAANSVSKECAKYETLDLYNGVMSMRVGSEPTSNIPERMQKAEANLRAEYNEKVDAVAAVRFLSPLAWLRVSPEPSSPLPGMIKGTERHVRSGANGVIHVLADGAGVVQAGTEKTRQVCVEIGPTVEKGVNRSKAFVRETAHDFEDAVTGAVNGFQQAIITQLNAVRDAFNVQLRALLTIAKNGRDTAISNVDQKNVQALIEVYKGLCKSVYTAQLAIAWSSAPQHKLLFDKKDKAKAAADAVLGKTQPREPWQDVHCQIEGPSVDDIALNFIHRWHACNARYLLPDTNLSSAQRATAALATTAISTNLAVHQVAISQFAKSLHTLTVIPDELIPKPQPPAANAKPSGVAVRVLRSAPKKLCRQEAEAMRSKTIPASAQCEIQTAMIKLINDATDFVYIENQFFQTAFGKPSIDVFSPEGKALQSGPTKFLMDGTGNNIKARLSSSGDAPGKRRLPENGIGQALGDRITRAIRRGQPFHVYMVLPVHPEGMLSDITIVGQIHWTMQSLVFAEFSLVNRIRRALHAKKICKNPVNDGAWNAALAEADKIENHKPAYSEIRDDEWAPYLTLLNLRNCQRVGGVIRTEQVYVHSKLLIVDDRHIIMGSANINDRSLSGERDSEIAVMLLDRAEEKKTIGTAVTTVNRLARKLRVDLWKKHLALANDEGAIVKPATTVAGIVERPASVETITAIQKLAEANASVYRSNFAFVPWSEAGNGRKGPRGASLWPVCPPHCESNIARQLAEEMPFSETFWTKKHGPSADPEGLSGFFTALPIYWTTGENNQPGEMNVELLTLKEPTTSKSTAYG